MGKPSLVPIILILINVVLASAGQIALKYGVNCLHGLSAGPGLGGILVGAIRAICTPYVFLGFSLYAISAIIWLHILSQVRLSIAYPSISMSYVVVVILSSVFLKEKVHPVTIAGLVLICFGVSLIGIGYASK